MSEDSRFIKDFDHRNPSGDEEIVKIPVSLGDKQVDVDIKLYLLSTIKAKELSHRYMIVNLYWQASLAFNPNDIVIVLDIDRPRERGRTIEYEGNLGARRIIESLTKLLLRPDAIEQHEFWERVRAQARPLEGRYLVKFPELYNDFFLDLYDRGCIVGFGFGSVYIDPFCTQSVSG